MNKRLVAKPIVEKTIIAIIPVYTMYTHTHLDVIYKY